MIKSRLPPDTSILIERPFREKTLRNQDYGRYQRSRES